MRKEIAYLIIFISCSFLVNADVVINEIMYNPTQSESYNEWIEIYNNGSEDINLTEWILCDDELLGGYVNRSGSTLLNNSLILSAFSYAVISDGGSGTEVYNNFNVDNNSIALHIDANSICSGLSNSNNQTIYLNDSFGNLIDIITYNPSLANEGYSIELLNPGFDNALSSNWNSSLVEGGTPGYQNSIFFIIDSIAPFVNLIFPESNSFLNYNNLEFIFNVIDNSNILNCSLYLNDILNQTNSTVLNNTLTYFDVFNLNEGSYAWNVSCYDESGNVNISETRLFNVDITDPSIFLSINPSILEFGVENTTANFTIIDTNLDSSIKNLTWPNGTLYKTFTDNLTITTENLTILGNYTVYIWANDSSGREKSNTFDIKVQDTIVPDIYLNYPENNTLLNYNSINFSYNVSDLHTLKNCSLIFNNVVNITNEDIINNEVNYFIVNNLPDGIYVWNVTCLDNSDNINSSSNIFTIDLTYPSLSSEIIETISTNSATLEFNTSEDANATIYYGTDLNLSNNFSSPDFSSNYSINLVSLNPNIFYYYNLTFCDRANNCNYSDTYNFTTLSVTVISSGDTDGSGGGGGSSIAGSGSVPQIIVEGYTITMYSWSTYNFILEDEQHTMEIKNIENNKVTLLISSEPIEVVLEVGESEDLDVNGNEINDLRITLISIEGSKVILDFEILEEIEEEGVISEENLTSSNLITGAAVKELEGDPLVGGIISGAIVFIGLILYFIFRKK